MPTAVPDEPVDVAGDPVDVAIDGAVEAAVELRLDEQQKSELTRMLGAINQRDPGPPRRRRPNASAS